MSIIFKYDIYNYFSSKIGQRFVTAHFPNNFTFFFNPMKSTFYALLAAAGTLLITPALSHASTSRSPLTDNPAEVQRKTEARMRVAEAKKAAALAKKNTSSKSRRTVAKLHHAWMALVGLEDSKAVTSPARRRHQLHMHQKNLKIRARMEARTRRARAHS